VFLGTFRFAGPAVGLVGATALGFGSAIIVLLAFEGFARRSIAPFAARQATWLRLGLAWHRGRSRHPVWLAAAHVRLGRGATSRRPALRRRLSPMFEPIGL
jgi:hypothetical protein